MMYRLINMGGHLRDSSSRFKIGNAFNCVQLELLEHNVSYVDLIDDNGNVIIQQDLTFPSVSQGFIVKAKRKLLKTLKDTAAYIVANYADSEVD